MNTKPFQQALKLFFAFALIVGLFVSASPTSALPQKAAPAADITPVTPDDTNYASQWNLSDTYGINAPMAWGVTTGSSSTVVAVLDTGITTHEDIALPPRLLPGYDFVSGNATRDNDREAEGEGATGRDDIPYDPGDYGGCGVSTWQGTHVTGIIGAKSDNNLGVAGINWNAKILPVRVIGTCGSVIADDIMDGMLWAADLPVDGVDNSPVENTNPANVIHVSASAAGSCTALYQGAVTYQAAIDSIIAKGIVIVAAAGDQNSSSVGFPANCNGVITVAATDKFGSRADYSNFGTAVEISAPGGEVGQDGGVLSTSETSVELPESGVDTYAEMDGTAMAAAHVSGVVSLMFDVNSYITPAQVSTILQKTVQAFPGGSTCSTSTCGWGILNGGEAVRFADMPDVIVTDVALSPNTPYFGQEFLVKVTVKNQGGLNLSGTNSRVALQVYVDRAPGIPDADGCIYLSGIEIDQGEFYRNDYINSIPSGQTVTLPVIINNSSDPLQPENSWTDPLYTGDAPSYGYYGGVAEPLPWRDGTHQLYVYADANCSLPESFEDNNAYSTYLTVNPFIEGALLYPRQGQNIETDSIPTFKWNKVMDATKYHIYVSGPSGKILDQWYTASQICDTLSPTCSANGGPSLFLKAGNYYWMMQYYKGSTSVWSEKTYFTVGPKAVNLTSPASDENLTGYTTTFTWDKDATATSYRLYVLGPGGVVVLDKTSTAASICNDTTCSVQSPTLKAGKHT
ncbi:partial serine protease, partial [Anaerolineae bacterium]